MVTKHAKRITTNSVLYMAASGVMACYGVYTKDTYKIAFAMWMVQAANYFKKDQKDDDVATREISLGE